MSATRRNNVLNFYQCLSTYIFHSMQSLSNTKHHRALAYTVKVFLNISLPPPPPPPSRLTLAVGSLCEEDDPAGGTKLVHANSLPRPPRPPVQLLDLDMRNRTKTEYFPALCRRNFVINPR